MDRKKVEKDLKKLASLSRKGLQRILRFPILILISFLLAIEFIFYLGVRILVHSYEWLLHFFRCLKYNHGHLFSQLKNASNHEEWENIALQLDKIEKREAYKEEEESPYYDYELIRANMLKLERARSKNSLTSLGNILNGLYIRSVCRNTIGSVEIYSETYTGTKVLVKKYIDEIVSSTNLYLNSSDTEITPMQKYKFLQRAIKSYGTTALCLSSGASLAFFHFGVVRALIEAKCMPTVFSGTSGGAMVAGWVAVRTDDEILELFNPEMYKLITPSNDSWFVRLLRLYRTGALFDWKEWINLMKPCCKGDTTFEEAYQMTGRVCNITMTSAHKHSAPLVLNHITAPNVVIWSAVLASAAIPIILNKVTLYSKENGCIKPFHDFGECFADGAIKNDLPFKQLAESFNVSYFIVSQTNPHLAPFLFFNRGNSGEPSRVHGSQFRGGFILNSLEVMLRLEMRKWLQVLVELDLLVEFFGVDWRNTLLQSFSGDITIVAKPSISDFLNIMENPTKESFTRYLHSGALTVWPRLSMIKNHLVLEQTLLEWMHKLEFSHPELFRHDKKLWNTFH